MANRIWDRTQKLTQRKDAWVGWFQETAKHQVKWHGETPRELRWKLIAGATLGTFVFGYVGLQLLTSNFHTSDTPVAIIPNNDSAQSSPSPSQLVEAKITNVIPYDPFGNDQESDDQANLAVDADATTFWTTATYKATDMGKAGVGLVLDLGSALSVSEVQVTFPSSGHSFTVYVGDSATPDVKTAVKLGSVSTAVETTVTLKVPKALTGQYVTIWLTGLPSADEGFVGGIANVKVLL